MKWTQKKPLMKKWIAYMLTKAKIEIAFLNIVVFVGN